MASFRLLTPITLLAFAVYTGLCAIGAVGCFTLRIIAIKRNVRIGMPGSLATDVALAVGFGALTWILLWYRHRLRSRR